MSVFFGLVGKNESPLAVGDAKQVIHQLEMDLSRCAIYLLGNDFSLTTFSVDQWMSDPKWPEDTKGFFLFSASTTELEGNSLEPGKASSGEVQCVIDGEIYTYKGSENNVAEKTTNQFFADAYLKDDSSAFEQLNAMFAGLVIDKRKKEILLVRDKHGMRSLFYADQPGYFFVTNALRYLHRSSLFKMTVDWNGVWNNLGFPAPPQPLTDIKDCCAVQRGHYLRFDGANSTVEKYWSIPIGTQEKGMSLNEAAEEIDHAMKEAVRLRTKGEAEIGTPLSGGVDSTYLAAHASAHVKGMKAFTFCLKGEEFRDMNENVKARMVAEKYGLNHLEHFFTTDELRQDLDEMIEVYDQVGANIFATYFEIVKKMKENGVGVMLSGLAADESHGGFHYFKFIRLWHMIRKFPFVTFPIPRGINKKVEDLKNLSLARTIDEYYSHAFSTLKEHEKKRVLPGMNYDSYQTIRDCYGGEELGFEDDVEGLLYYMFANAPNHHLYRFDQFSSHFGVKTRYPFLDDKMVEVAFRIPSRFKVHDGVRKIALKEAAKPYLPEEVLIKKKHGLVIPVGRWVNEHMGDWKREKLEHLKARPEVSAAGVDYIDRKYASIIPGKIVRLVMLEVWLEKYDQEKT